MSTEQFTESEIEILRKGATGAGLLVGVSDKGFFDTFKEAGAMAKHLSAATQSADSPLIKQVAEARGTGFGLTASPDEVEAETLQALRESAELLQQKAPEELDSYRTFVLELARSVSTAAGGGEEVEAATIAKIDRALGTGTHEAA
jgi:hypothetical protein